MKYSDPGQLLRHYSIKCNAVADQSLTWLDDCDLTFVLSAFRFYGGMLIVVFLLYLVPVGWVLAGLNSAIFLCNRDFFRGQLILAERITNCCLFFTYEILTVSRESDVDIAWNFTHSAHKRRSSAAFTLSGSDSLGLSESGAWVEHAGGWVQTPSTHLPAMNFTDNALFGSISCNADFALKSRQGKVCVMFAHMHSHILFLWVFSGKV